MQVKTIYRNTAELVIGILVKESETHIFLQNPVILGASGENGQISLNFIPQDMLNIEKTAISVRHLLKGPQDIIMQYEKSSLLMTDVQISDNVVENYLKFSNAQVVKPAEKNPENNIIKLFD